MFQLSKYILLLASVVGMVTYAAGLNPPRGAWKETVAGQHLAGESILRGTHYYRYLVFFYCNATAFAASLLVTVVILIHNYYYNSMNVRPLQAVMVVDLLCLMGAYVAGSGQGMLTTICSSLMVASVFAYLVAMMAVESCFTESSSLSEVKEAADELMKAKQRFRKILLILATFSVSITYTAGLSTPGGIWDTSEAGHHPGDAILTDRGNTRLTAFFLFNSSTFSASLLFILMPLNSKLSNKINVFTVVIILTLMVSLMGAYVAGSCRHACTTFYTAGLVAALPPLTIGFRVLRFARAPEAIRSQTSNRDDEQPNQEEATEKNAAGKARSLVVLLSVLAAATTYLAGLHPPGGVWPDNTDSHKAGDPILLTTNARRFKAFFYFNSVSFSASLVAIVFAEDKRLLRQRIVEAVMTLDLFGLLGAYVAGSNRDVWTFVVTFSMAAVILIDVVFHIVTKRKRLRTRDDRNKDDQLAQKTRKRLLLFTILVSTITYWAGLTPPGGFLLQDDQSGHRAGVPVLSYNFPLRYKAFVICNSVSFMLSTYILLRCLTLNRPATRGMLSLCMAAVMYGLMGAYAAGSSQHLKTSIYIFALIAVVLFLAVPLFRVYLIITSGSGSTQVPAKTTIGDSSITTSTSQGAADGGITQAEEATKRKRIIHAGHKCRVLLGAIVAGATYTAGLEPPGGAWQSSSGGHEPGSPVMFDTGKARYVVFFFCNSISFVASILVILLQLVPTKLFGHHQKTWLSGSLNCTIALVFFGLQCAYAAGSARDIMTSVHVILLLTAVLSYCSVPLVLSIICKRILSAQDDNNHQERRGTEV